MITSDLQQLRKEYAKATLDIASVSPDPLIQFGKWFDEAMKAGVPEPNAMSLATVSADGRPSQRIVLLKGVEAGRFTFYSNYQSRKGTHLEANPACALTFFWPELERQVRIEGIATRVSNEVSTAYFQSRPRGSQLGAWASPQSAVINDRSILEARLVEMEARFRSADQIPKPQQWGGYSIEPSLVEFWQGRPSRLHDRIEFVRIDGQWKRHRLAP